MSGQVSHGSAGEYQADEHAGVARLSWRATVPGGKGANQAVALGRLGADVRMLGQVGDDLFGRQYLAHFRENGVDPSLVAVALGLTTGVAAIEVSDAGENHIVVVPGANGACDLAWLDAALPRALDAEIFLLQLEIPLDTVWAALERLKAAGKTVVLDPAPAVPLPDAISPSLSIRVRMIYDTACSASGQQSAQALPKR